MAQVMLQTVLTIGVHFAPGRGAAAEPIRNRPANGAWHNFEGDCRTVGRPDRCHR